MTPGDDPSSMDVFKNDARSRFEIQIGDQVAILRYRETPGRIDLIHTEVPDELAGRGIAGRLASFALDYARGRGLGVKPTCPYVAAYIERHPEYADLVEAA
jgi:predicted GNAT family acetyltransferase